MLTLTELNTLNFEDFVSLLGNVIENCPVLAAALWTSRPFKDFEDLKDKMKSVVMSLPTSGSIFFLKM